MQPDSRGRRQTIATLVGRGTTAAVVAALLAGAAAIPTASAAPADDLGAVVTDYAANDGIITPCRFSQAQLESVRSQLTPDYDEYDPDFRDQINREIGRWQSGGCSTSTGGGGGGNGGSGGGSGSGQAYRASISKLTVAKNRRSARVKLHCPSVATTTCKVTLSSKLAGKSASSHKSAKVARGSSKTVTLKLNKRARTRLASKGGKLKVSARTAGSSLASASRTKKVAAKS